MPARGRDEQEARVLVAGVVEAIEAAGDERVVERADREQPLAEQVARQAERGEHQEQVGFSAMPSSMCWPWFVADHFCARRNLCGGEDVLHLAPLEQAALVDPGAEVGRDGDVGRGGDDAVGKVAAGAAKVEQDPAERGLGRLLVAGRRGDRGDRDRAERAVALVARRSRLRSSSASTAGPGVGADPGERLPFVAFGDAHRVAHARAAWVGFISPE